MAQNVGNLALPARCAGVHVLAGDPVIEDCVCNLHAMSPVVERMNRHAAVAIVLRGSFHIRATEGAALATSGALLLKNAGSEHAYQHIDEGGDRTLTFFVELDRPFAHLAIPASPRNAAAVAFAAHALASGDVEALCDAAHMVASLALVLDGSRPYDAPVAYTRRVVRALRYIDAHPAADCSLATLAASTGLSAFHFSRIFRALVGQTPRQYVIAARLRAAAAALVSSRKPVTEVALDAGFVDLSNFMATFRRAFGVSPRRYRVAMGQRARPSVARRG
ncbi:MAG: helix-turn-helix transcriptional regulator [Kofleriaceae bacterium]|nr:helix-turn-helix transcriptional regulator [Kofleriaceae bacterium]